MEKIVDTASYGISVFSLNVMQEYLKREKIKSKKVLNVLQKDEQKFINTQKEGIWFVMPQINSIAYNIKIAGIDEPFNDEWEKKFEYEGFNIEIEDGVWVTDIGEFYEFSAKNYMGDGEEYTDKDGTVCYDSKEERWYLTDDGEKTHSAIHYDLDKGKYKLTVCGFSKIQQLVYPNVNNGFLFSFTKVDEFEGYKNSREDIYDFNIAEM